MKLGLIATSGVRAQDENLTQIGLTLPGFVERNETLASLPTLSLLTLAALTPAMVEIEYREIDDFSTATDLPDDYDLVAISSLSAQIFQAYALADWYRKQNVPVVMGGLHVSSLPEEALQHCTSVVVGEGEPLWPQVLSDFAKGALKPRYIQSPMGSFDLAHAPVPRFDLLDSNKYNRIAVQTSRGCPWRCEFCASSIMLTPKYKIKPVEKVIEEIRAIKKIWARPFIELADDNSFVNNQYSKKLLRAFAGEKIRWFAETDISVANDDELLELMRDSGCKEILIGLESPRKTSLKRIELRADWKYKQHAEYQKAIAKIQSFGIRVNGCFIFGLDDDDSNIFEETHQFIQNSGLYDAQITIMTAFPNTPLYQRLQREERLIQPHAWDRCTLFDINFTPKGMSVDELKNGFLWLAKKLYSQQETSARRQKFKKMLKHSENFTIHANKRLNVGHPQNIVPSGD